MSSTPVNKPGIIAIIGPTASGKTALSLAIAKHFPVEIVSADSRQIYRGMDIGTAKASAADRAAVPHHLVDIRNPDEEYTVADFKRDAIAACDDIIACGKLPILVGGTGLYIKAVVENLDIPNTIAIPALRREIEQEIETQGLDAVFKKLITLDPDAAYVVDPHNPRRIVRALEVAIATGEPFTAQRRKQEPRYEILEIGLNPPPEILRERIDRRVNQMIEAGLVAEVTALLATYPTMPISFDAIGYREIIDYKNGKQSLEEAIAAMKLNTWHFAKRQMTWFKKDSAVHWVTNNAEAIDLVTHFLKKNTA
jgi:tRNA dimethylallyltransferase